MYKILKLIPFDRACHLILCAFEGAQRHALWVGAAKHTGCSKAHRLLQSTKEARLTDVLRIGPGILVVSGWTHVV